MNNTWTNMNKDEKLTRILAMKAEGYTNKEIGEFYGVTENAVQKAAKKAENQPKRTLSEIHTTPINNTVNFEMFSSLLEKIESLELEVANIKKLQVETASIERLEESEYKYFAKHNTTGKEEKFKTAKELFRKGNATVLHYMKK